MTRSNKNRPLRIGFQMDPLHTINPLADSTFLLIVEAQRRGYDCFYYHPQSLSQIGRKVSALAAQVSVIVPEAAEFAKLGIRGGKFFELGEFHRLALETLDVIWLRQDPPFDLGYITTSFMLEAVMTSTLVVNNPVEVRNAPEKLFVLQYESLMPPTLVTRDFHTIAEFRKQHRDIIIKPLYGNGGFGVFHLQPDDENLSTLIELFNSRSTEPVMVQKYIGAVKQGDKRIILIDGEPVGAINRVPMAGEARANMHAGGIAEASQLTKREKEICTTIGADLKARGLLFVGIDVIGDYLTEINVTSPTGLQEINRFDRVRLEAQIWDAVEKKL